MGQSTGRHLIHGLLMIGFVVGSQAGCGGTAWDHPTKGTVTLQKDMDDCEQQARQVAMEIDPHSGHGFSLREKIQDCLRSRGYIRQPPP